MVVVVIICHYSSPSPSSSYQYQPGAKVIGKPLVLHQPLFSDHLPSHPKHWYSFRQIQVGVLASDVARIPPRDRGANMMSAHPKNSELARGIAFQSYYRCSLMAA